MKIIGTLVTNDYEKLLNECSFIDTWFLNIEKISFSHFNNFTIQEVQNILNKYDYKFIINLEKIYSEDELIIVKSVISKFKDNNKVYFSYSDFGILQLLTEENITRKIYHTSTMLTNTKDIEIALLENEKIIMGKEISLNELFEIDKNLTENIAIDAFGKFPIFYSKRKLLSTYFKYRNYDFLTTDLDYALVEEFRDDEYPITEQNETLVYEPYFYVLGSELKNFNHIDEIAVYPQFLDIDEYIKVLNLYHSFINNHFENTKPFEEYLNVLYYKGKLAEKTILKKGEI